MDDPKKNTLDDLADLFLTHDAVPESESPASVDDLLSGPPSIKLPPKAARSQAPHRPADFAEPPEPTLGDLDELTRELLGEDPSATDYSVPGTSPGSGLETDTSTAEFPSGDTFAQVLDEAQHPGERAAHEQPPKLRLAGHDGAGFENSDFPGPDDPRWSRRENRPGLGVAEAVVLGNLPGMAGPWLTQYGQLLAQQDGAVVILHVDDDAIDLELLEPTSPPQQTEDETGLPATGPSLRVPPGGFAGRDLVDVLDQLNRARVSPVRTVLVHLDATEEALPRLLDLDYWTLLSGADDAAIVAGYRLLKRLLESDGRVAGTQVGLMVVGSDQDAGHKAAGKLRTAVANFLQTPLELIGYQPKMIPARCRTLGRFGNLEEVWPRLTAWLKQLQPPAPEAPAAEPAPRAALPELEQPVRVEAAAKQPRAAEPEDPHPHPQADATPDLFSLIDSDPRTTASIPGGLALEARCPSQPHTQLALDATGRLHLLHRHDSAEGDPPTPKEAIVELVAVRDWARQHRQLLQLTERGRRFDPDADPVLHLFTDRADLSVHLVARLGDLLKLHLLRDVTVGNERTFFCTPLSA
ncbi:MAG: hypothetical protein AAF333_17860 [Planctomycetota bacterium]